MVEAGGRSLVELPVTTFPGVKTPIHVSYLIYLSTFSRGLAMAYWRSALAACRIAGVQPSLLLHPLDFMSGTDADELKFFPGMSMPVETKLDILNDVLSQYANKFEVVNVGEHAAAVRRSVAVAGAQSEVML
jgi:hypothetical protein